MNKAVLILLMLPLVTACAAPKPTPLTFYDETTGQIQQFTVEPVTPMTEAGIKACHKLGKAAGPDGFLSCEAQILAEQLQRCWSIQAGARYAEDTYVKVRLTVGRDRRITSSSVVDMARYKKDPYFRSAADAALRAVASKECKTLAVPPDKYNVWKDMVVTFDPRAML